MIAGYIVYLYFMIKMLIAVESFWEFILFLLFAGIIGVVAQMIIMGIAMLFDE